MNLKASLLTMLFIIGGLIPSVMSFSSFSIKRNIRTKNYSRIKEMKVGCTAAEYLDQLSMHTANSEGGFESLPGKQPLENRSTDPEASLAVRGEGVPVVPKVRKKKRRHLFRLAAMATLVFSSDFLGGLAGTALAASKGSAQMIAAVSKVPETARIIPTEALPQRAALQRRRYAVVRRLKTNALETETVGVQRAAEHGAAPHQMEEAVSGASSAAVMARPIVRNSRRNQDSAPAASVETVVGNGKSDLFTDSAPAKETVGRVSTSFVSAAVKEVGPAVVRIDAERLGMLTGLENFGVEPDRQQGMGSGFIISEEGYILTNCHVVEGAEKVTVTLTDGRKYLAKVKGYDEITDLAVIMIDTDEKLPVAPLADSSSIEMGDWVIALGNPIGLDNTVTLGIISNVKRSSSELGMGRIRCNFIQTDAAINPGNSGGPLVNEFGEVIGINTAIFANAEGIGFAIPINKAKEIIGDLAQGKNIQHPYIGVMMVTITPEFAEQYNSDPNTGTPIPEVNGAMVVHVMPEGPAGGLSGLRKGDILMEVNDQPVRESEDGQRLVNESQVGDNLKLTVLRGGKQMEVFIKTEDFGSKLRAEKEKQKEMESALGNMLPKLFQIPEQHSNDDGDWMPAPPPTRRPSPRGHRRFSP